MSNPLSADIRVRFEVLFAEGLSGREIGRRLMISAASASRLSQKLKRGLQPAPAANPRNSGHGRLAPYHDFLIELIHQDSDIKGAMDGSAFAANIEKVLVPDLEPGTVVISDTLPRTRTLRPPAVRDAGSRFLFLLPCRPDLLRLSLIAMQSPAGQ